MAGQSIHGMSRTPEYRAWINMRRRCNGYTPAAIKNYVTRGVTVCHSWDNDFMRFYADMGPKPTPHHTIERVDNDNGYSPENCIWATRAAQSRNKTDTQLITQNGETLCAVDWSHRLGGEKSLVRSRIKAGWNTEDAVTKPKQKYVRLHS